MISIIIPTYNRSDYIQRAINSVLEQTYKDFELIIVDDNVEGSDAHLATQKIVTAFNDNRIRYIKNKKNLGGALSRNTGIFAAKYISPQINRAVKNKSYFYNCYGKEEKFYIENQG